MSEQTTATKRPRRDYSAITLDAVSFAPVKADDREVTNRGRAVQERTEVQKHFDKMIAQSHAAWVKAGKPLPEKGQILNERMPQLEVKTSPEKVETLRALLTTCAQYAGVSIKMGKTRNLPDGVRSIKFCVVDRSERKPRAPKA